MRSRTSFHDLDELDGGYATRTHCRIWVAVGVAVVGTAVTMVGQRNAAKAQAGQARVQGMAAISEGATEQEMRNLEAADIRKQVAAEADNIKRSAAVVRGQLAVAQSGSGVMIGEGSAQAATDQLDALSSADALAALYSGVNKSSSQRASGRFAQQAGSNRNRAAGQAAGSYESAANFAVVGGLASIGGAVAKGVATPAPAPPTGGKA